MINIPDYIDCKNKEIEVCDYLLTDGCPSTCAYALDIGGVGVGATMIPVRQDKKGIQDKLLKRNI